MHDSREELIITAQKWQRFSMFMIAVCKLVIKIKTSGKDHWPYITLLILIIASKKETNYSLIAETAEAAC